MINIEQWAAQAVQQIQQTKTIAALEKLRVSFFGKQGIITTQLKSLHNLPAKQRSEAGKIINAIKQKAQLALDSKQQLLQSIALDKKLAKKSIDISLPGRRGKLGGMHPITSAIERIKIFFQEIGFEVKYGPEIEDGFHNFDALNIPENHPARDDHDTFYFNPNLVLRTQTSSVQIRTLEQQKPPLRIISPGRVYRNDYDHTHTPMFHQVEGLMIDRSVSFAELRGILTQFLYKFFESKINIRFRPSYFPFTEPSAEVDILGKQGWLEVLGCGMVNPSVFKAVNLDSEQYTGFAFGMGIERLIMLKYDITDLRAFFENDIRFLRQFH